VGQVLCEFAAAAHMLYMWAPGAVCISDQAWHYVQCATSWHFYLAAASGIEDAAIGALLATVSFFPWSVYPKGCIGDQGSRLIGQCAICICTGRAELCVMQAAGHPYCERPRDWLAALLSSAAAGTHTVNRGSHDGARVSEDSIAGAIYA
jgi:hypothetical protein